MNATPRRLSRLAARALRTRAAMALGMVLTGVALAWLVGLAWYAATIPERVEDGERRTDAIVVLTGGSERLATGLRLLEDQRASKLFVSGVYRGTDVTALLHLSRRTPNALDCCIVLGHAADSTIGNAAETAAWMRREGFRSLRLVTSNYHMRRSLLEFREAMPEMDIIPHPVFPGRVKEDWWRWPGTAHLIANEYTKYLLATVRHWVLDLTGDDP